METDGSYHWVRGTVDRLPTSVISVTTTENCLSFAN